MPSPPPLLTEGTIVGKWRIGALLGQGGQGAVFQAKPVNTRRLPPRALKVCFSEHAVDRQRFEREIELLSKCESPHVVPLLDADKDWKRHVPDVPEFAYYVTEKCDGSLQDRREHLGDVRRRLALFVEACQAIIYLHELPEPIIHRDIKPENFLIAKEPGRIVVGDFGIARELDVPSAVTATHEIVGSQFFRAPEVLNGAPSSRQSDVYSLGRVLEWLVTGEVSKNLGVRPLPRGDDLSDEACDAVERVLAKATQVVAVNRFQSVRELVAAVPTLWFTPKPRSSAHTDAGPPEGSSTLGDALALAQRERQRWLAHP